MVSISTDIGLTRQTAIIAGTVTALATVLATYIFHKLKNKSRRPVEWKPVGKVTRLCIYPLKSGRKIEVEEAECTKQGLMEMEKPDKSLRLRDRAFVVYREENYEYRTAKQCPKLLLIEVKAYAMNSVVLNAPDMKTLIIKVPSEEEQKVVTIKHFRQEEIKSIDCGDEVAIWISQYILGKERGLRLAYNDGRYKRTQINIIYKDLIDFYGNGLRNESSGLNSDLAAMHIINKASVIDFNKAMGNSDITVDNFRPTLLVDGPNLEPFEEDNWEWIKVGNVVMKNVVPCFRYRMKEGPEKTPVMGILLEVFETGIISIGETVYVGKTS